MYGLAEHLALQVCTMHEFKLRSCILQQALSFVSPPQVELARIFGHLDEVQRKQG